MAAQTGGGIDFCDQHRIFGWTASSSLSVYVNGEECGQADLSPLREDHDAAGLPGARAFEFAFASPLWLNDRVTLRLHDSSVLAPPHDVSHLPRLAMLVAPLDLSRPGLEFGPLHRPSVPRLHANVYYVDHEDQQALRQRYAPDLGSEVAKIPPVDFVWAKGRSLSDVVGDRRFGWVVACHMAEHVPDLIGWLQQIEAVLDRGGCISLIMPHGERTFDACRPLATIEDLLAAHVMQLDRPSPHQVLMHLLRVSYYRKIDLTEPAHAGQLHDAIMMARHARDGAYVDVHCNVFTPASFARCYVIIRGSGLVGLHLDAVLETARDEFFVRLTKAA